MENKPEPRARLQSYLDSDCGLSRFLTVRNWTIKKAQLGRSLLKRKTVQKTPSPLQSNYSVGRASVDRVFGLVYERVVVSFGAAVAGAGRPGADIPLRPLQCPLSQPPQRPQRTPILPCLLRAVILQLL